MEDNNLNIELKKKIISLKKQTIIFLSAAFLIGIWALSLNYKLFKNDIRLAESNRKYIIANGNLKKVNKELDSTKKDLGENSKKLQDYIQTERDKKQLVNPQISIRSTKEFQENIGKVIYIHKKEVSQISSNLEDIFKTLGFIVPKSETIVRKFGNSVKYFNKEDETDAIFIQKSIYDGVKNQNIQIDSIRVFYLANKSVPKGQFEIWIDK